MSLTVASPVTGGAQTGFTTPSYTVVTDFAPTNAGKQIAVSAITGAGVPNDPSSVSRPFTWTGSRPASLKQAGVPNPVTGILQNNPLNIWKLLTRKGLTPLAGQAAQIGSVAIELKIPAGADLADTANVRSMISLSIGVLNQISASLGDSLISGNI